VTLVFDRHGDIPNFGIVLGFFQENFVVHDHALALFLFDDRLGRLAQARQLGIHLRGLHTNPLDPPHRAFRLLFLSERRLREEQPGYHQPIKLLHGDFLTKI
jgi:hypothetical protein